jgi:hypothetical protein
VQLGFEQVHRLQERLLLAGGELVEDAGDRAGGAVEPFTDQLGLVGDDRDDGAPPVGGVGVPFDEAGPVEVGEHAADGGQGQPKAGGQFADRDRAAANLLAGTITVAAASVDTKNKKRDEHLRSAEFFDVARTPDITFTAEQVTPSGDGVTVTGTLTVRDRTHPVSFAARVSVPGEAQVELDGEVQVNRAEYGLTWSPLGMASMHNAITVHAVFTRQ